MRELGRMPALAICEDMESGERLLCHCRRSWSVRGVSVHRTVADAKAKAAQMYPGIAPLWRKAAVSRRDARDILTGDLWLPPDAHFLNVDLDLKSRRDPALIARAWTHHIVATHLDRIGRRHWWRFNLASQPADPAAAIRRYVRLVDALPHAARTVWDQASVELDVGFAAPAVGSSREWLLPPAVVRGAAAIGAAVRITVYPPEPPSRSRLARDRGLPS